LQSLVDGVILAIVIFGIDAFLSKRPIETALLFAVGFGVIAFALRVFTRPFRAAGSAR
jgi:multisubunit Na+/H+ antiporter MnhB subunit